MAKKLRVLLVEDHAIVREGLRALLATEPGLEVIAEAADGWTAVRMFRDHNPDIVLMDLSMPKMNGIESIRHIKRIREDAKILVLTVHSTEEYVREALTVGASGFIQKDCGASELVKAIDCLSYGQTYLCSGISDVVVRGYIEGGSGGQRSAWDLLTDRERQVLKLVAEGARNKDIAEYLFISEKTVEKHRANMMKKLNLHSVSALTTYCLQRGLIEVDASRAG
jgi:DNA-binding NarL/FixJ family response regulator